MIIVCVPIKLQHKSLLKSSYIMLTPCY